MAYAILRHTGIELGKSDYLGTNWVAQIMPVARTRDTNWPGKVVPRSFFHRPAPVVGPELLNKVLASADGRAGRIVEVEAYVGAVDPAAHTFRGKTPRNATMFGPPGHMYVYFTYGMHWCCNCVCGSVGEGSGVLIRALEPIGGLELMRAARARIQSDRDLCRGPARLTQALGITGAQDGIDLVKARQGFTVLDDGMEPPADVQGGARIGISKGMDLLWRWHVPGSRYVSGRAG
jgi:DNA-3-methyladenine glycosylase